MKYDGWDDDDVFGPDDDSHSRALHQRRYLIKMRAWCKPGRVIRIHFPNSKHSSHHLHGMICLLVRREGQHTEDVWIAEPARDYDPVYEQPRILHATEFRPVDPLTALAHMAE